MINYIIAQGVNKLAAIRLHNPNAAGLIVASDKINHFRFNETQWIVSVDMVSEGTDIPRLQVCCHLSRVKTELYFRQVLGRILRISNNSPNQ